MAVREELSPRMRQRYGLDRNPWPARILSALVALAFAATLGYVLMQVAREPIETRVLTWDQPQADRVDITFEVRRPADLALTCALRAQDSDRIDLGYATTTVPAGSSVARQSYSLRVLGPASYVEVLGCAGSPERLRVPPANFPPGVAPPTQPWTAG